MGRLGLGLSNVMPARPVQGDLFDIPEQVKPVKDEPKNWTPEPIAKPEPAQKKPETYTREPERVTETKETYTRAPDGNVGSKTSAWDVIKYAAYGLLVLVELSITGLAMWSIGDSLPVSIGLTVIGVSASILGIYLFLRGDLIGVLAWLVYAVLFVLLNWSWTVGNMVHEAKVEAGLELERLEMESNNDLIKTLLEKQAGLNQWAVSTAESIERQVIALRDRNKEIKAVLDAPRATGSTTFKTMERLAGLTAEWWWLGALVVLQGFQVLLAPRRVDNRKDLS